MRAIFFFITLLSITFADELSSAKVTKLVKKGEQIANTLCNKKELLSLKSKALAPNKIAEKLQQAKSCGGLSSRNYKALSYFLFSKKEESNISKITVPHDAKCPVCGMFVYKYPRWAAQIFYDKKHYSFDGMKDLMKWYFEHKDGILQILTKDYYSQKSIDATKAYYVFDSDIYGPMGNELIAFKNKIEAKSFSIDHRGTKILHFKEITPKDVYQLD